MKWQKVLENKKITVAVLLALIVLVIVMVMLTNNQKESSLDSDIGKQTQQNVNDKNNDTDDEHNISENNGTGELKVQDVLDENDEEAQNSTSASGTWGEEESSNEDAVDDKSLDEKEPEDQADKEEDIVESDIVYGDIY